MMEFCEKCKEYRFSVFGGVFESCKCRAFIIVDEGGDEHIIYSFDPKSAALKYAEQSNESMEYCLMSDPCDITVDGNRFTISAEPTISYSASAQGE